MCLEEGEGQIVPATVADHIEPVRCDPVKMWTGALQSLCAHHHSSSKFQAEHRGFSTDIGEDGFPRDKRHPFWRERS
jgi:5-methylcytosine-specific restriction enzyme A